MLPSNRALDLIKQFEGLRLKAYKDSVDIATIGYGSTRIDGRRVRIGEKITKEKAEQLLLSDVLRISDTLNRLNLNLNQNQFDALISFIYNVGIGNFKISTMYKLLKEGLYEDAAKEFLRWNKAGGKVLSGLTKRRLAEQKLFLTPIDNK